MSRCGVKGQNDRMRIGGGGASCDGNCPHGPATRRSTPEPCPFPPLARIGSYSRYHPSLAPRNTVSPIRASFPLPSVFLRPCNFSGRQPVPLVEHLGPLKGRELPSASSLTCARWPCEEGQLAYAIYLRSLVRSAHTSTASFPTFPRTVTWNSRMHLGATLGAPSTEL
jgi:hypothetical protein